MADNPFVPVESPQSLVDFAPAPQEAPGFMDTLYSSFYLENDVANTVKLLRETHYPVDNSFDPVGALKAYDEQNKSNYMDLYGDKFANTLSRQEFDQLMTRVHEDEKHLDVISRAGGPGTALTMLAAVTSPTIFIPFAGEAQGLARMGQIMALAGIGAGLQEIPLQAAQPTRTGEQAAWSIGTSMAFGAVLGGVERLINPSVRGNLEAKMIEDMRTVAHEPPPREGVIGEPPTFEPAQSAPLKGAEDIRAEEARPVQLLTGAQEAQLRQAVREVAGDVEVRAEDRIEVSPAARRQMEEEWGVALPASGKWTPEMAVVTLSREAADLSTAHHEAFHVLQDMYLTDKELKLLDGYSENFRGLVAQKYGDEIAGGMTPRELQAEAFAMWMRGKAEAPPLPFIKQVWDKIKNLISKTQNVLRGWGFENAESLFERAKNGEVARREKITARANVVPEGHTRFYKNEINDYISVDKEAAGPVSRAVDIPTARLKELGLDTGGGNLPEEFRSRLSEPSYQMAWHGSPHWFNKFMTAFMGTGEGAQTFGWGLYFAQRKGIAENYRNKLARPMKTQYDLLVDGQELSLRFMDRGKAFSIISTKIMDAVDNSRIIEFADDEEYLKLKRVFYSFALNAIDARRHGRSNESFADLFADRLSSYLISAHMNKISASPGIEDYRKSKAYVDELMPKIKAVLPDVQFKAISEGGTMTREGNVLHPRTLAKELAAELGNAMPGIGKVDIEDAIIAYARNTLLDREDAQRILRRSLSANFSGAMLEEAIAHVNKKLEEVSFEDRKGRLYQVDVPEDYDLMNWALPFNKQPQKVQDALRRAMPQLFEPQLATTQDVNLALMTFDPGQPELVLSKFLNNLPGSDGRMLVAIDGVEHNYSAAEINQSLKEFGVPFELQEKDGAWGLYKLPNTETLRGDRLYRKIGNELREATGEYSERDVSLMLADHGIPGHKFLGSESRDAFEHDPLHKDATYNFVIYSDDDVEIKEYFQAQFRANDENFQRWFGNSKIIDDGEALPMYTGTSKDVDFDKFKAPKNGIWFTRSTEEASNYAIENDSMGLKQDGWNYVRVNTASRVIPVYLSIDNPLVVAYGRDTVPDAVRYANNYKKALGLWFDDLKRQGYNGVVFLGEDGKISQAVAFEPTQIKSVYNKGAWAPTDPRISYQITPETKDDLGGFGRPVDLMMRANNRLAPLANPVTQTILNTASGAARWMMTQMSDAGLAREGNMRMHYDEAGNPLYTTHLPTTKGGTIESRVLPYWGDFVRATEDVTKAFTDYVYGEGKKPMLAPGVRAALEAKRQGKLTRSDFNRAVTMTLWNGFESAPNEFVERAARAVDQRIYQPLFERAKKAGLIPEDAEIVGDKGYANRLYNTTAIQQQPQKFVRILAEHYEGKLREKVAEQIAKFTKKAKSQDKFLTDALLSPEDMQKLREELTGAEESLIKDAPDEIRAVEDKLAEMRASAKKLRKEGDEDGYQALWAEARQFEKDNYHSIKGYRDTLQAVRQRLNNLTKGVAAMEEKKAKKLEDIERLYAISMNGLNRIGRMATKLAPKLAKISDKELAKEVARLKTMLLDTAGEYYNLVDRLAKKRGDEDIGPLLEADASVIKKADRLNDLADRIDGIETADRDAMRAALNEALDAVKEKVNEVNSARGARIAKLAKDAAELDPAAYAKSLEDLRVAMKMEKQDFARELETQGVDVYDLDKGEFGVKELALSRAEEVKQKILGETEYMPQIDLMQERMGPELMRVLDIPSARIAEFLETDINKLMRIYVRTFAADVELAERFGTINFRDVTQPITEEYERMLRNVEARFKDDPEGLKKENEKIYAQKAEDFKNLRAVWERLRGIRGMPTNADAWTYRAGKVIMELNTLRMMGMVLTASLPDVAAVVIKYGLTRTVRDGIVPMITNFKEWKMSALEGKYAGAAVDTTAHLRATAFHDLVDDAQRGTGFEKGVHYLASHMGVVGLFDIWTDGMKMLAASIANGKIIEALAAVHGGESSLTKAQAMEFLAKNSIGGDDAARMWKEITENGGATRVNGVWYPATENWKDPDVIHLYRSVLAREVNNTIVTPGVDKPTLADATMVGRMLYQFKSFSMAANTRLVMSGVQQGDMAVLNGMLFSIAMGMVGYAAWAATSGGDALDNMQKADMAKWLDEGIQRSGLLGNLGEIQRIAENIPGLNNFTSFSGQRSTRRPGDNIVEALLGPSFDFLEKGASVVGGLTNPTWSTLHAFRKMSPYQNTMFIRELFDRVEEGLQNILPERRDEQ